MIDRETFKQAMGILGGSFGREVDAPVIKTYYAILSAKLTTEEFRAAVKRVLETERFWPSPAVLLAAALGTPDERADGAFRNVYALAGGGRFRQLTADHWRAFDGPTRTAIRAIGGLHVFEDADEFELARLTKTFKAAYRDALEAPAELRIGAPDAQRALPRGTDGVPGLPPLLAEGDR